MDDAEIREQELHDRRMERQRQEADTLATLRARIASLEAENARLREERDEYERERNQWRADCQQQLIYTTEALQRAETAERQLAEARRGRDERQETVATWCAAAFGADQAGSVPQRGVRLLEEAIEAYQAASGAPEMAHKLVDYVFGRPAGELSQELGGVGVTVLALAEAAGISADVAETTEIARVTAKPLAHFAARNAAKNAAGFDTSARAALGPAEKPGSDGEGR